MKNNKILYHLIIFFLFFIFYSNCQSMENSETDDVSSHSSSHSASENEDNDDGNSSGVADLLAHVQSEDSKKTTGSTKVTGFLIAIPAFTGAVMVMAPFANLTGYLFHDGISPVVDNGTCSYNATYNPSLLDQTYSPPLLDPNVTSIALEVLYTGGLALVPAITGCASAIWGGGNWLVDKGRSVQQGFRNFWWPDQKAFLNESDNHTIQGRSKSEKKKSCCSCIPKKFKNLNYYIYSRPVEFINGLFWSEFYFNFIATTLIAAYSNDPIRGQVWGYLFASVSVPFVYHLYTHVTGEADKRSFYRQNNQHHAQNYVLALLNRVEQGDATDEFLMSFFKEGNRFEVINHSDTASRENLEVAWRDVISLIRPNDLEEVKAPEQRKRNISRIFSFMMQGVQFPLKVFAQYMLARKFCWALGASPDLALIIAAPVTAVLTPFLGLGSLREKSLIQYECYQILEYFSWPRSCYAVAARGVGIGAAFATIPYWAAPTWYAYQREILYDVYCHQYLNYLYLNDLRVRAPLAALFSIPAWCVGRQFFECQFNRIFKIIASKSCCSDASEVYLPGNEKNNLRQVLQRISYLLRKSQYVLEKKSYELDETVELIQ